MPISHVNRECAPPCIQSIAQLPARLRCAVRRGWLLLPPEFHTPRSAPPLSLSMFPVTFLMTIGTPQPCSGSIFFWPTISFPAFDPVFILNRSSTCLSALPDNCSILSAISFPPCPAVPLSAVKPVASTELNACSGFMQVVLNGELLPPIAA
jgi:hypothetical protein